MMCCLLKFIPNRSCLKNSHKYNSAGVCFFLFSQAKALNNLYRSGEAHLKRVVSVAMLHKSSPPPRGRG